jgi:hypothetical protein
VEELGTGGVAAVVAGWGEFVEEAGYARLGTGTVADLLDRWLAHASP